MAGYSDEAIQEFRRVAFALADAARSAILPHFRSASLSADNKLAAGFDPVTIADQAAEDAMRDVLSKMRPDDAVLGEEFGEMPGTSGLTWVLDPIDGTRGFLSGTPTWGVLIALADETGPILGVIDQPYIGERFHGGFGAAECIGPQGTRRLACRAPVTCPKPSFSPHFPRLALMRNAGRSSGWPPRPG